MKHSLPPINAVSMRSCELRRPTAGGVEPLDQIVQILQQTPESVESPDHLGQSVAMQVQVLVIGRDARLVNDHTSSVCPIKIQDSRNLKDGS
jgi:hypothetical protein